MEAVKTFFRRLFFVLIFFTVVGISIVGFMWWRNIPLISLDPFNYVPTSAIYVLETEQPVQTWEEISNSAFWTHMRKQPYFKELTEDATSLDTLIHQNRLVFDLLGKRQLVISAHMTKQNDYDFLFILDLKREFPFFIEEYIGKIMSSAEDTSKYVYNDQRIFLVKNQQDNSSWAIAVRKHLLFCSQTPSLIEQALRQQASNTALTDSYQFRQVADHSSNTNLGRIFINYNYADEFLNLYLDEPNEYANAIFESLYFSGLNLDLEEDKDAAKSVVRMKGVSAVNDSLPSHLRALLRAGDSDMSAARVVPQRSAFYFSVNFDDFLTYYDEFAKVLEKDPVAYQEYQNQIRTVERLLDINVRDNFFSWIGTEMALIQTEPVTTKTAKDEYALVLKTKSMTEAMRQLEFIGEKIRKRTPVRVVVSEHQGHKISMLAVKGFFKLLMGKYFEKIEKPYFTFIEDYVIFSNSPETLKGIIDDYEMGLTLAKSTSFQEFFKEFEEDNSTFFAYVNMPVALRTLKTSVSNETWISMQKNSSYIISQPHWGFQLKKEEKNLFTTKLATVFENPDKVRQDYGNFVQLRKNKLDQLYSKNIMERMFGSEDNVALFEKLQQIPDSELINLEGQTEQHRLIVQEEDKTRYEYEVVGNIKDGIYREFREGKLIIEGFYKNNRRDGKWIFYDKNGKIKERKRYKNGNETKFIGLF